MNAKDINDKWQAEINTWIAYDKVDQSTSEKHKIIRDKIFNGKAKWWYDPYDSSWNVMTNDEVPVEVGQKYIYIGETNKMKKVKQYKDEETPDADEETIRSVMEIEYGIYCFKYDIDSQGRYYKDSIHVLTAI